MVDQSSKNNDQQLQFRSINRSPEDDQIVSIAAVDPKPADEIIGVIPVSPGPRLVKSMHISGAGDEHHTETEPDDPPLTTDRQMLVKNDEA